MKGRPELIEHDAPALWERVLLGTAQRFFDAVRPPAETPSSYLFATEADLRRCGLIYARLGTDADGWPAPSITLAGWPGTDGLTPIRCDGRRHPHALIVAPTGAGKTWTTFLPTLMRSWTHSIAAFDVKGELHRLTSGHRSAYSHVLRFAPAEPGSTRYNPLDAIRTGAAGIGDARNIAEHLAPDEDGKGDRDPFWDQQAKAYLAGAILFVMDAAPPTDRCLAGVARAMARGRRLGDAMARSEHPDEATRAFIRDAATRLWRNTNERLVGSVTATVDSYLAPYAEPAMAEATRTSDFRPSDLMCRDRPVSLYLASAKPDLERTKPLLRILVSQVMAELQANETTDRDGQVKRWKLLWALDELPVLGRLANLGTDLPVMRSFGMRALMGAQGVRQVCDVYGKDTPILNNARWLVTRQNSLTEAREISGLIGEVLEIRRSVSRSWAGGFLIGGRSETESESWRPAMQPAEIARMPIENVLVMGEDQPVMAKRSDPAWWRHLVREPAPSERLT